MTNTECSKLTMLLVQWNVILLLSSLQGMKMWLLVSALCWDLNPSPARDWDLAKVALPLLRNFGKVQMIFNISTTPSSVIQSQNWNLHPSFTHNIEFNFNMITILNFLSYHPTPLQPWAFLALPFSCYFLVMVWSRNFSCLPIVFVPSISVLVPWTTGRWHLHWIAIFGWLCHQVAAR